MYDSKHQPSEESPERRRIEVRGIVQGVGFRPFVFALAVKLSAAGFVRNHSAGVTIEVEASAEQLERFLDELQSNHPPLARIDAVEVCGIPARGDQQFVIVESIEQAHFSTPISPDIAVCSECLAEMRDSGDRRFQYPFINCTNCGPRFTIVRDIPYDRPQTTMHAFPMCDSCEAEYHDPANRRFHAQPNACPNCGPRIWFVSSEASQDDGSFLSSNADCPTGNDAVELFRGAIEQGLIVAVKGIGGFHLACDAENDEAIARLRQRKGRIEKPFAVMVAELEAARKLVHIDGEEERLLTSKERPIVLLKRRADARRLSKLVAPGNDYVGIMLPYSPLHHLLVSNTPPLVMTSGNVSEEPIVRTNEEARQRLSSLADVFLLHDREIHVVCDDSVIRVFQGRELPIRRSRGYAPMPIRLSSGGPSVLAVGGELKAAFCLAKDDYAYMSQHIGDMGNLETLNALGRSVRHFCDLFRVDPEVVACDLHPEYLSTRWAKEYAAEHGIPCVQVQHHHAHIASVAAEHNYEGTVIGVSFDGTGYGTDGAIWGGEVLLASRNGFDRMAHLKYVPLPGGDTGIRRPYRIALAHLWAADLPWHDRLPCVEACPATERSLLLRQLESKLNCVNTSSMGRLFDAVASLVGIRHEVNYEAQAAMEMEAMCSFDECVDAYDYQCHGSDPIVIDSTQVLSSIADDVLRGASPHVIASRFHMSIVKLVVELCQRIRQENGINVVALSGGVFQNVLLLRLAVQALECECFRVLVHRWVPPNDGGIALGQAAIARCQWV